MINKTFVLFSLCVRPGTKCPTDHQPPGQVVGGSLSYTTATRDLQMIFTISL